MQRDHNLIRANHLNRNVCAQAPRTGVAPTGALPHVLHTLKATAAGLLRHLNTKPIAGEMSIAREVCLGAEQLWSTRFKQQTNIVCRTGVLWITLNGDARDYILQAGQDMTVSGNAQVVFSTFSEAAKVTLHTP